MLAAEEQVEGAQKGGQRLLLFPQTKGLYDAGTMERLVDHLDICKEVRELMMHGMDGMVLAPAGVPSVVISSYVYVLSRHPTHPCTHPFRNNTDPPIH